MWIPDCACLDVPKLNLGHRSFFGLGRLGQYVNKFIQIFFVFFPTKLASGVRLLLELYCVGGHQSCCLLYYLCKIAVTFYTSLSQCGCGFGFQQKYWRINGFGKKRRGSADLHTPIHPPHQEESYSYIGNSVLIVLPTCENQLPYCWKH